MDVVTSSTSHSPSTFLFVNIRNDGVLGEGELVISLSFILVHRSHRALTREHRSLHISTLNLTQGQGLQAQGIFQRSPSKSAFD